MEILQQEKEEIAPITEKIRYEKDPILDLEMALEMLSSRVKKLAHKNGFSQKLKERVSIELL